MNKTQNYQLNQWVKSDRVLMDDFNADNAKLDAALKAEANARSALEERSTTRTIKTVEVGTAAPSCVLDLSDINWYAWREVLIAANIYVSGGSYSIYPVGTSGTSTIGGGTRPMSILLFPLYRGGAVFSGLSLGDRTTAFSCESPFNSATGLRFNAANSGETISGSSSFTVYGIK